ncbi:MAG TPA: sigma-70 family RNA polymerase sigma factor [Candidatus Dormibacteraeota bacterium]|nr:sigma-70 family RNA polymerase sigma factor [Candidatus Dormibacteraeota bacterium]
MEGRPLTDRELIEMASHGDVAAYEELVRRYEQLAFRVAYLVCHDADEARDATQEGFLRAWHALPRFRSGAEPRPWLMQIVANAARNRRRGSTRRTSLALRVAQDRPSDGAAPSPEVAVLADERRRELLAALNRLREEDRLVIALRWFAEQGEAEMAAALGVARGTVKSRLSRAMGRLREVMATDVMATDD